jgi:hypothetical protein
MEREGLPEATSTVKTRRVLRIGTQQLIPKVKRDLTGLCSLTRNQIARKHQVSRATIQPIINRDLQITSTKNSESMHFQMNRLCRDLNEVSDSYHGLELTTANTS